MQVWSPERVEFYSTKPTLQRGVVLNASQFSLELPGTHAKACFSTNITSDPLAAAAEMSTMTHFWGNPSAVSWVSMIFCQ